MGSFLLFSLSMLAVAQVLISCVHKCIVDISNIKLENFINCQQPSVFQHVIRLKICSVYLLYRFFKLFYFIFIYRKLFWMILSKKNVETKIIYHTLFLDWPFAECKYYMKYTIFTCFEMCYHIKF